MWYRRSAFPLAKTPYSYHFDPFLNHIFIFGGRLEENVWVHFFGFFPTKDAGSILSRDIFVHADRVESLDFRGNERIFGELNKNVKVVAFWI